MSRVAHLEDIAHKREFYKMDQWTFAAGPCCAVLLRAMARELSDLIFMVREYGLTGGLRQIDEGQLLATIKTAQALLAQVKS